MQSTLRMFMGQMLQCNRWNSNSSLIGRYFTSIHSNTFKCQPKVPLIQKAGVRHTSSDVGRPSYVHGSGSFKLVGSTMGEMIDMTCDKFGDTEAVVDRFQGIRRTFSEFKKEVDEIAMGFLALNLKRGDLLGIWSPNRYEWMLAQMAAAKAGLIVTAVNSAYQKMEFENICELCELKALIIPETFKTQNYYEMVSDVIPEIKDSRPGNINSKKYPHFNYLIMMTDKDLPGVVKFGDLYGAGGSNEKRQLEQLQNEIQMDDDLIIMFTSGTTGRPKGATLTHFGAVNNSLQTTNLLNYHKSPHRVVCTTPLFHVIGGCLCTYATMVSGAACVFPGPSYDPLRILQTIEEERCTSIIAATTVFIDLLNHPKLKETDISSIFTGVIGGSPVSPELFQALAQKLNLSQLQIAYGATETTGTVTANPFLSAPADSVGHVIPNTEVKIVDSQNSIVPMGVPGEICVRGFQLMKGYWNEPEKTKEVIRDGWYHTGDVGTLAEEGHLTIVGRIKEMIIRGGENIYPREIEDFLSTHPKIAAVQAFGVGDERMGEELCVWIRLKDDQSATEHEMRHFCRGKIAHFKVPKYIRFVSEFPVTLTGKVQKFVMKQQMENLLKNELL